MYKWDGTLREQFYGSSMESIRRRPLRIESWCDCRTRPRLCSPRFKPRATSIFKEERYNSFKPNYSLTLQDRLAFLRSVNNSKKFPQHTARLIQNQTNENNISSSKYSTSECDSGTFCDCHENASLELNPSDTCSCFTDSSTKDLDIGESFRVEATSRKPFQHFRCLKCQSYLSPPLCSCGKTTYCKSCKEITPCARCPSTEDLTCVSKCSRCTCALIYPHCPCGRALYCIICEELQPCNCEQYHRQPKCSKCGHILSISVSPSKRCGHPTYCWACEEHEDCNLCQETLNPRRSKRSRHARGVTSNKVDVEDTIQEGSTRKIHGYDSILSLIHYKTRTFHRARTQNEKTPNKKKRQYTMQCY